MLANSRVATRLPAHDLDRARAFYSEKLGLEPVEERPGGLLYRLADGEFALFRSAGAAPGSFTQMAFEVDDHTSVVAELKRRGVVFEEVDLPGLRTLEGVAEVEGNYPSKGARGSAQPGFVTARGTCWAWDSRCTNTRERARAPKGTPGDERTGTNSAA